MKKLDRVVDFLLILFIVFCLILFFLSILEKAKAGFDRFERQASQMQENNAAGTYYIDSYHDKDSGVEFICVTKKGQYTTDDTHSSLSCFLTGRNWKEKR